MFVSVEEADLTGFWEEELSTNINKAITCGITEEHSRTNRKHVWFFAYTLRVLRKNTHARTDNMFGFLHTT